MNLIEILEGSVGGRVRRRKLMTAVTVVRDGLLRFPVTVETRRMISRHSLECRGTLPVTDSAVVVVLRRACENRSIAITSWCLSCGNSIVNCSFDAGFLKRKPRLITRRGLRMTHRTDRRPGAAEELRSMTAYARIMTRIIIDIRKRYLVTRITRRPMLRRRVRKLRIINSSRR